MIPDPDIVADAEVVGKPVLGTMSIGTRGGGLSSSCGRTLLIPRSPRSSSALRRESWSSGFDTGTLISAITISTIFVIVLR